MKGKKISTLIKTSLFYEIFYNIKTTVFDNKILLSSIFVSIIILSTFLTAFIQKYNMEVKYVTKDSVNAVSSERVKTVFVCVTGEVKNPGLYKLTSDKRISDAIKAAGGTTENASVESINLAQKVSDEMYINIPSIYYSDSEVPDSNDQTNLIININTANISELCKLPNIGEKYAERIIDYRQKIGGFKNITDIMDVSGIGQKIFDKIKNYITL